MRHVSLTCKNHPDLRWSCKSIAYNYPDGGYNGCRHIFYLGDKTAGNYPPECTCPARDLVLAPEETWDKECEE